MTNRLKARDTDADLQLRQLLDSPIPPAYFMTAGAGSGKTTSLVKALAHVGQTRGDSLMAHGQRVACVTYTEVAAAEILEDIRDDLFWVSTIHQFLWRLVSPFQRDIKDWAIRVSGERLATEELRFESFGPRTGELTRSRSQQRIARYRDYLKVLPSVSSFTYGIGSNFGRGVIGHSDVVVLALDLLKDQPLLGELVSLEYPYIFVDESQDTFPAVADAMIQLRQRWPGRISVGFFGDPMQRIYTNGVGSIPAPDRTWVSIEKPENFRSSRAVLGLINGIRSSSPEKLIQRSGLDEGEQVDGDVTLVVLPRVGNRVESLQLARNWLAEHFGNEGWAVDGPESAVKMLVITHRMAARRLGFEALYDAFHEGAPVSLSDAFDEGRAWPIQPFLNVILPLVDALDSSPAKIMGLLRTHSPAFSALDGDVEAGQVLTSLRAGLEALRSRCQLGGHDSVSAVLEVVKQYGLCGLGDRWEGHLGQTEQAEEGDEEGSVLSRFLASDVRELWAYRAYVRDESPYSTQQGVKGAEFENVVVVVDDDESRHFQFSYDKLLGLAPLSKTDLAAQAEAKDSVLDRTRRLLYVCCSRATVNLAVVVYVENVDAARAQLGSSDLGYAGRILVLEDLVERAPVDVVSEDFPETLF